MVETPHRIKHGDQPSGCDPSFLVVPTGNQENRACGTGVNLAVIHDHPELGLTHDKCRRGPGAVSLLELSPLEVLSNTFLDIRGVRSFGAVGRLADGSPSHNHVMFKCEHSGVRGALQPKSRRATPHTVAKELSISFGQMNVVWMVVDIKVEDLEKLLAVNLSKPRIPVELLFFAKLDEALVWSNRFEELTLARLTQSKTRDALLWRWTRVRRRSEVH